jgi:hypothetical protein
VADWTIAMDDALTERFSGCSACGRWPPAHVGLHLLDGLALATSVCRRCGAADPQQVALGALLAARYDPRRWDGP